ncbi:oligosaccharyl transferase glycoprotein complex, beta subunit [Coemansia sp. RSA 1290]|nr:oligosaccharyl transferase glycoprotein complex, beta subunit [Coemansia sp. RSA 1290]KAJ2651523.1 oligosaccharyl transferase glycoprotein complex, beta subunit [Coemansia sp. RSA 1250]
MRLHQWIWLALGATPFCAALSAAGERVLVVVPTVNAASEYSDFLDSLAQRGFDLSVRGAGNTSVALHNDDGTREYDHAVLLAPAARRLGTLSPRGIVNFVNDGGNLIVAASSDISENLRSLATQFGVDFAKRKSRIVDHVHGNAGHTLVPSSHYANASAVLSDRFLAAPNAPPVYFEGIGHRYKESPLLIPLLTAPRSAYSSPPEDSVLSGTSLGLVSVFQTRTNARVAFSGSTSLFSNRLLRKKGAANRQFVTELSQWVLQEKAVLRASPLRHALASGDRPDHYRVSSDVVFEIDLTELRDGSWQPYRAHDVQLEAIMLDPYIRTTLNQSSAFSVLGTYRGDVRLPDRYGTFTFRVNYKRPGLSNVDVQDIVGIRPLRHDEYPRFLSAAYPYYASSFVMILAFLALSAVWLWSAEPKAASSAPSASASKPLKSKKSKKM